MSVTGETATPFGVPVYGPAQWNASTHQAPGGPAGTRRTKEHQQMSAAAHGHTPAAWTGVTIAFVGFCVSGVAMILPSVPLVWAGLVVVAAGGVVGKAMSMAGMGKQPSPHVETAGERTAVTAGV